jgi:hypothetical protein
MVHPRCSHCGDPVPNLDKHGHPKPGPTPKYCSDRCRKRAARRLPNVPKPHSNHTDLKALPFDPKWVPKHPVDEPVVRGHCEYCGDPLYRRGQAFCGKTSRCRVAGQRLGIKAGSRERTAARFERERIARIRQATLVNDAIDHCSRCDDDGLLRDGTACDHSP